MNEITKTAAARGGTTEPEIEGILCRAIIYEVLALSLGRPNADVLSRFDGGEGTDALLSAAAVLDDGDDGVPCQVTPALEELVRAARTAEVSEVRLAHERLFGHTARGRVPPYETEYGSGGVFQQTQELADLNGFYRAFGLRVAPGEEERGDHISAECEFLSFLASREAWWLSAGDTAASEQARSAARLFLRDHAGRFGRAFARSLAREADHPFYRAAGELCFEFLSAECRRAGVRSGPEFIPLRPPEPESEAVPMACGGCGLAGLAGLAGAGALEEKGRG